MIEVYENTSEAVELRLYNGSVRINATGTPTVTVTDVETGLVVDGPDLLAVVATEPEGEYYKYVVPLSLSGSARRYKVEWSYDVTIDAVVQSGKKLDVVDVVRAYVTAEEVRNDYPALAEKTNDEISLMERRVRKAIESYCGQDFNKYVGITEEVRGTSDDALLLPKRIISLTQVVRDGNVDLTTLVEASPDNPWTLRRKPSFYDDVKAEFSPNLVSREYFGNNAIYRLTGDFGWDYVPNEVNLAAKLLIGTYFCSDFTFRNRNVHSVKTMESSVTFFPGQEAGTGNIEADHILDAHVAPSWMVL